jgi:hypothetical protein
MMGHADAARIAMDSVPVWDSDGVLCLTKVIPAVCTTALANGVFCANDPDVTYAGPRKDLTPAEWRTWHGFVGLLGGLVAFSDPLHALPDDEIRHLEILRPPAPEPARAFGAAVGDYRHFGFVARRPWGDFAALQLWNPSDEDADVPLPPRGWKRWANVSTSGRSGTKCTSASTARISSPEPARARPGAAAAHAHCARLPRSRRLNVTHWLRRAK